jgi:hypothetical protein
MLAEPEPIVASISSEDVFAGGKQATRAMYGQGSCGQLLSCASGYPLYGQLSAKISIDNAGDHVKGREFAPCLAFSVVQLQ